MVIGILTDIHGNLEALEACLSDARAQGVARFAVLGDVVGYGADPGACVQRVRALLDHGGFAIRGNHDAAVAGDDDCLDGMNNDAAAAVRWTRGVIDGPTRDWLASLPLTHAEGGVLHVHADARRPEAWGYITGPSDAERALRAVAERIVFCGHVHTTTLYQMHTRLAPQPFDPRPGQPVQLISSRSWLAVIGAVGQPRDGDPRAIYALYDTTRGMLTIRRVAYDIDGAARKIEAAGLPRRLHERLYRGG